MAKNKLYLLLLLFPIFVFGQQKKIQTAVDSTKIKIGSQFNLTLKTTVDTLSHVVFPEGTNFGRLEVLESYPIDTIKKNATYELVKKYGLTQFDSGRYIIPSLPVLINNKSFPTDSLFIEVNNIVVDTLKQGMYDIKPILNPPLSDKPIWKYILIFLLFVGITALCYWLFKKYKKKDKESIIYSSPIEKASSLLKNLEQKELWQRGEVKIYYSELTDIARNYIEEALEIPAMEITTNELLIALRSRIIQKKMALSQETLENLERVLKHADLVKFAKSKPLDFEIADDRNRIEKVIAILDKSIPEPTEEELALDQYRKEQGLREQRKRRILFAGVAALFLLFITTGYFVITMGINNLKDTIFGNSTKELLEGEWIGSEYGDPSVFVETPRVLTRYRDDSNDKTNSNVKGSPRFIYGSLLDKLYVMVMTSHFSEKTAISLEDVMDQKIKTFETQYSAKNILVKQEDYDTKQGITGKKLYGTMTIFDPIKNKEMKMAYQILIFLQNNGLQEIIITSREEDEYALKIAERIINSAELKKIN